MPVESEQAQASRAVTEQPEAEAPAREPDAGEPAGAGRPLVAAPRPPVAAPRPPHDEHELPDGRYLLAYRSAPGA
jgi:hypothetical protein